MAAAALTPGAVPEVVLHLGAVPEIVSHPDTVPEIVFEDAVLLAVNKPAGLLVHRSAIAAGETDFLVERLRERFGRVWLVHRLDRATSGLVLLARTQEAAAQLGAQFMARTVGKRYLAVVRGWPDAEGVIDHALPDVRERSPRKAAVTRWRTLATATVPIALGRYPEQRYALLEAEPLTGRYRQIRKHLHHVSHPVIGDTSHGRGDHNRLWRMHFGVHRLLLHAWRLALVHPLDGRPLLLQAPLDATFGGVLERFAWTPALPP